MERSRPAAEDVRKAAQRFLPVLIRSQTVLVSCLDVGPDGAPGYVIVGPKTKWQRPIAILPEAMVTAFISSEWIARLDPPAWLPGPKTRRVYTITELGRLFLKRSGHGDDGYAAQHRICAQASPDLCAGAGRPKVNLCETPTGWLRQKRPGGKAPYLSQTEYDAGEQLRQDFAAAGMEPSIASHWQLERVDTSVRTDYTGVAGQGPAAAKRRFWAAVDSIGPDLAAPVVSVCCFLRGLEATEMSIGLPKRSGKVLLKAGLSGLARHYGLDPGDGAKHRLEALLSNSK